MAKAIKRISPSLGDSEKVILLVITLFCIVFKPLIVDANELIVFSTYPPTAYLNPVSKEVEGPIPELIRLINEKIGSKYKLENRPLRRMFADLNGHKSHACHRMSYREERIKKWYYSYPVDVVNYNVYVHEENPLEYNNKGQLANYTIGLMGPSNNSNFLREMTANVPGVKIKLEVSSDVVFKKLNVGRYGLKDGAVHSSNANADAAIKKYGLDGIRLAGLSKKNIYYVVFDKQTVNREYVDRFNIALLELYNNGTMAKIYSKYKGEAVAYVPDKSDMKLFKQ